MSFFRRIRGQSNAPESGQQHEVAAASIGAIRLAETMLHDFPPRPIRRFRCEAEPL